MAAGKYDLPVEQGATLQAELTLKNAAGTAINLTGTTVRGQIRKKASDSTKLVDFTCTINATPTTGKCIVSLTAAQTSALPAEKSLQAERLITKLAYDIELVQADNSVVRVLEGVVLLSPEVTR